MKTVEFTHPDYSGEFTRTRRACRGIVLRDGLVLLSHYPASGDLWMIPGGGKEEGETDRDTVIREVAEESGYLIQPEDCALEIMEYFGDMRHINHYFPARVAGETERKPTDLEERLALEPRWLAPEDALAIFARYDDYAGEKGMKRGLYLREYMALKEVLPLLAGKPW